ncbi:MAG TPA: hypothetical protein VHA34_14500, partial [Actinomycetes bacterium]|nr:hypothetical protein [Actinomycetes bacterium]
RSWEVAIVTVGGSDDSWEDRDESVTEDVGLPEHERDEGRRRAGDTDEADAAEVAAGADTGRLDADLPAHEDDARRAEDTATGELNP